MLAMIDSEKTGFVDIVEFAKQTYNIKEPKPKDDKKGDKNKKKN